MQIPDHRLHGCTESTAEVDTIRALVRHGQCDPTVSNSFGYDFLKSGICGTEGYVWVINQEEWEIDILEERSKWYQRITCIIGWQFAYEERFLGDDWTAVVRRLHKLGLSPSPKDIGTRTPLDSLFDCVHEESDSHLLADKWLFTLSSAGVDVESYLHSEELLHGSGFLHEQLGCSDGVTGIQRRLIFKKLEGSNEKSVFWEWAYKDEGPASLVLTEFRLMCIPRFWDFSTDWTEYWPFLSIDWRNYQWKTHFGKEELSLQRRRKANAEKRWLARANKRCQRIYRTPRPSKLSRLSRQHRIPGAWVQDGTLLPWDSYYQSSFGIMLSCCSFIILIAHVSSCLLS